MNRIPDGGVRFPGLYDIDNRVNGFIAFYTQDSGAKCFFVSASTSIFMKSCFYFSLIRAMRLIGRLPSSIIAVSILVSTSGC